MNAHQDVACQIEFTSARANDITLIKKIQLAKGAFIVFDKGYVDYG